VNKQALLELVGGVAIMVAVCVLVLIVGPGSLNAQTQAQWYQLDLYADHHGYTPIALVPIGAGYWHTCALTSARGLKCWGNNYLGSLGDGTTVDRDTPVAVTGLSTGVAAMDGGWWHTCALTSGGGVKCWGANGYGQLGNGSTTKQLAPVSVSGLASGVTAISVGGWHTCALTSGGGVKCWGANENGRLGDGTTTNRSVPVDVVGLSSGVIAIAAGGVHTCALTSSGGVKCWGYNYNGSVGDGTSTDRHTPVDVIGLGSGVISIAAGGAHTCALTSGHEVKCWGSNWRGELGDGTTTERHSPVTVIGLGTDVHALATGGPTCALTTGGGVKCWGDNAAGQLGDGTMTNRLVPVDVIGLSSGATAIAVGIDHACAQINDYGYKCWGYNSEGELGDGTTITRTSPVDVVGFIPLLSINYTRGRAGSFFTLTGTNFPPACTATITVNGRTLGTIFVDSLGNFTLILSTANADDGQYFATVSVNPSATVGLVLDSAAPLRTQSGSALIFAVPAGSAFTESIFLPMAQR
jgi:alpha-tubulin suppressor-like RCC1 family protein